MEGFIPLQNISEYVSIYRYCTQHHGVGGGLHTPTEHIGICEYTECMSVGGSFFYVDPVWSKDMIFKKIYFGPKHIC